MLRSSFRWLAGRVYPRPGAGKLTAVALALAAALAGCGGGTKAPPSPVSKRVVGPGFSFEAPARWPVQRVRNRVSAAPRGNVVSLLSVQTFRLVKPYRRAMFARTARELDVVAERFAATLRGTVVARRTVRVAGLRVRQYDIGYGSKLVQRTTFVLRGRREYQLTCRFRAGESNPLDGGCARLLASFRLTRRPA